MKKKVTGKKVALLGVAFALLLTACGSGGTYSSDSAQSIKGDYYEPAYDNGGIYMDAAESAYDYEGSGNSGNSGNITVRDNRSDRKLIRTANMSVETLEFDTLLVYVENRTAELGGYVESLNVRNNSNYYSSYSSGYHNERSASLTLRIPKENMDFFLTEVADNSNILNRSESEKDVTLDYVDLDSHKKALKTEQARLLELLEQAETLEEILILEDRLSEIRYQIESMESRLRTYDNQIDYGTIYLDITEVVELTPVVEEEKTTWERIADGFVKSLKNVGNGLKEFGIWLVVALPYLALIAVVVVAIILIIKLCVKRSRKKRAKRLAENPYAGQPRVPVMPMPVPMAPMPPKGMPVPPQGMPVPPQGMPVPPKGMPVPPQGMPVPPKGAQPLQGAPVPPAAVPVTSQKAPAQTAPAAEEKDVKGNGGNE